MWHGKALKKGRKQKKTRASRDHIREAECILAVPPCDTDEHADAVSPATDDMDERGRWICTGRHTFSPDQGDACACCGHDEEDEEEEEEDDQEEYEDADPWYFMNMQQRHADHDFLENVTWRKVCIKDKRGREDTIASLCDSKRVGVQVPVWTHAGGDVSSARRLAPSAPMSESEYTWSLVQTKLPVLQRNSVWAERALVPWRRNRYSTQLPQTVIDMIIHHFVASESIYRLLWVCKSWRAAAMRTTGYVDLPKYVHLLWSSGVVTDETAARYHWQELTTLFPLASSLSFETLNDLEWFLDRSTTTCTHRSLRRIIIRRLPNGYHGRDVFVNLMRIFVDNIQQLPHLKHVLLQATPHMCTSWVYTEALEYAKSVVYKSKVRMIDRFGRIPQPGLEQLQQFLLRNMKFIVTSRKRYAGDGGWASAVAPKELDDPSHAKEQSGDTTNDVDDDVVITECSMKCNQCHETLQLWSECALCPTIVEEWAAGCLSCSFMRKGVLDTQRFLCSHCHTPGCGQCVHRCAADDCPRYVCIVCEGNMKNRCRECAGALCCDHCQYDTDTRSVREPQTICDSCENDAYHSLHYNMW